MKRSCYLRSVRGGIGGGQLTGQLTAICLPVHPPRLCLLPHATCPVCVALQKQPALIMTRAAGRRTINEADTHVRQWSIISMGLCGRADVRPRAEAVHNPRPGDHTCACNAWLHACAHTFGDVGDHSCSHNSVICGCQQQMSLAGLSSHMFYY